MNTEIKKALIYLVAALIVSCAWIGSEILRRDGNRSLELLKRQTNIDIEVRRGSDRYALDSVTGDIQRTFLLDKQTGKVWRYYRTMDENRSIKSEGFDLIKEEN